MECEWSESGTELAFQTGRMAGLLVADPDSRPCHCVTQLYDRDTGTLVSPDAGVMQHAGSFTLFRAYAKGCWLTELRNTKARVTRKRDGVELSWEPTIRHQVRTTARITIREPNIIDAAVSVEGHGCYSDYELLFSSYVAPELRGSLFVKRELFGGVDDFERIAVIDNPAFHGMYTFFPRDERAANVMTDGRGQRGRHYWRVAWGRPYACPMAMASNERTLVALMGRPQDVSSVGVTYWSEADACDGVAQHHALYLSLFARDLRPGDGWRTRVRLAVGDESPKARDQLALFRAFMAGDDGRPETFEVHP